MTAPLVIGRAGYHTFFHRGCRSLYQNHDANDDDTDADEGE
jgi:hypothetical protein